MIIKAVIVSDTHWNSLRRWKIPYGDILIHCGDLSSGSLVDLRRFADELEMQPHKHKVVVSGNHDMPLQYQPLDARKVLERFTYLQDEAAIIEGLKFYGAPWQPDFKGYAFNLPRCGEELQSKWQAIPDDTDVLVTHCPPDGILDWVSMTERAGCQLLRYRLDSLKPVMHCFGHIHCARGYTEENGVLYVNAACAADKSNNPVDGPTVVEIDVVSRKIVSVERMSDSVVPHEETVA